jgi:hypothetical protein
MQNGVYEVTIPEDGTELQQQQQQDEATVMAMQVRGKQADAEHGPAAAAAATTASSSATGTGISTKGQGTLMEKHMPNTMHQAPITAAKQAALLEMHVPNTMYMSSEGTATNPQVLVVQTSGGGGRRGGRAGGGGGRNNNSSAPDYTCSAAAGGSGSQQTAIYSVPMEVDPTAQINHYNLTIPKARALRGNGTNADANTTADTAATTTDVAALPQKNNVYDKWGTGLPEASPAAVMASVYGDALYTYGETGAGAGVGAGAAGSASSSTTYYGVGGGGAGGRTSTYQPGDADYYSAYDAPLLFLATTLPNSQRCDTMLTVALRVVGTSPTLPPSRALLATNRAMLTIPLRLVLPRPTLLHGRS